MFNTSSTPIFTTFKVNIIEQHSLLLLMLFIYADKEYRFNSQILQTKTSNSPKNRGIITPIILIYHKLRNNQVKAQLKHQSRKARIKYLTKNNRRKNDE